MKMNTLIRPATRHDLSGMKSVIDGTGLFPSEMLDDMITAFFDSPDAAEMWFVTADAAAENAVLALAYCAPERMTEGTWNVYLIAVDPSHQGQGLGAALMGHIEALLAAQGERIVLVETSGLPEFERTRQFYLKNGYTLEARIRAFYAAGEDKIVFHKEL